MPKPVRISLATKCQLLFGAAVILILTAALAVVWVRMQVLVQEGQEETARRLANAWLSDMIDLGTAITDIEKLRSADHLDHQMSLALARKDSLEIVSQNDPFVSRAVEQFEVRADKNEYFGLVEDSRGQPLYRYVRAIRKADLSRIKGGAAAGYQPTIDAPGLANPLEMILVIELRSVTTAKQLAINTFYLVGAGLLAGLLAIGVFWFITMRLILSPVRVLTNTAEKIADGDISIRSEVHTGDEFQHLSEVFNHMLETLKSNADQLRSINKSLDIKVDELAQANLGLYEANKVKGEFLANVSHELRTPLNSIIGFAELLEETLKDRTGPIDEKRKRYAANIINSGKRLLDLINDLLDLAKIEAGRVDIRASAVPIADTLEGLINLIRPQAEKNAIKLELRIEPGLPIIYTDAGKFQQIIFNFLSNAVKFTPAGGVVTLAASLEPAPPGADPTHAKLKASVIDTGPGIPPEQHERIFEKFTQLDSTVTKSHGGTGLGLTISRELASLLQGKITLESEVGHGANFSLIIPITLESRTTQLLTSLAN